MATLPIAPDAAIVYPCAVTKKYMRFNPQTGAVDYHKGGDQINATAAELEEFPDCLKLLEKPVAAPANSVRPTKKGAE